MPLTLAQITDLLRGLDRGDGQQQGRLRAAHLYGQTPAQARFVADVGAAPLVAMEPPYQHPGRNLPAAPRRAMSGQVGDHRATVPTGLTVDDYGFLAGLANRHPAALPLRETRRLLALHQQVHRLGVDPADRDLVDQFAEPVRNFHDEAAARVDVRNAEDRPFVPTPPSAVSAAVEAIAAAVPDLTLPEAVARAQEHVDGVSQERLAARQKRIDAAHASLDEIKARPTYSTDYTLPTTTS